MYIVYSTTKSFALYPVSVLIVAGVPTLAVNVPERLVVIPMLAATPVKFEPSIAGRVPVN